MQKNECLAHRGLHIRSAVHLTSMAADRATLAVKDTACVQAAGKFGKFMGPTGKNFGCYVRRIIPAVVMGLTVPEIL